MMAAASSQVYPPPPSHARRARVARARLNQAAWRRRIYARHVRIVELGEPLAFAWLAGSDNTTSRAIIVDFMVPQPCVKTAVTNHGSDRFGGAATRAGADGKRRAFAAKIQNDPSTVRLHQSWIFRPWIVTPFGDMNSEMLEDLTGIASMIAAHRLRGCFDAASRERAERTRR